MGMREHEHDRAADGRECDVGEGVALSLAGDDTEPMTVVPRRLTAALAATLLVACAPLGCTASPADDAGTPADDAGVADERPAPFLDACATDPACTDVLLVAHRGEGVEEPENTIAALLAVAAAGADVVEVDVRETSDGVLVVLHDDTLSRTTDQETLFPDRARVDALTLAEVKSLTIYDEGARCTAPDDDVARCRVPTLRELLAAARGHAIVMLDYKAGALSTLADDLLAEDAASFAFFFDANEANLDEMEGRVPGIVTMPRASDAATGIDLLQRRAPRLLHADAPYVGALVDVAAESDTKLFINVLEVDFGIIGHELTGDAESLGQAEDGLALVVEDGADLLQSNRAPVLRDMLAD